jgi:RHS repeat protein
MTSNDNLVQWKEIIALDPNPPSSSYTPVNDFRVTTFSYDARDRMTGQTDADPDTTSGNGNTRSPKTVGSSR